MSFEIKSELKWNGSIAMKDFDIANNLALEESAILVEGKAAEKVQVDSGDLKRSITRSKIIDKIKIFVGTILEYAPFVEFGTRFSKAFPFLSPAYLTSISAIKAIFKKRYKAVKYVD